MGDGRRGPAGGAVIPGPELEMTSATKPGWCAMPPSWHDRIGRSARPGRVAAAPAFHSAMCHAHAWRWRSVRRVPRPPIAPPSESGWVDAGAQIVLWSTLGACPRSARALGAMYAASFFCAP
jgi:hypothetical protein